MAALRMREARRIPRIGGVASRPLSGLVAVFSASLWLSGCRDKVAETHAPKPRASAVKAAPNASAHQFARPGPPGQWVEAPRYRLRVLSVVPCDPAPTGERTQALAARGSGKFRLGVTIEVEATEKAVTSAVVASPKAATLEKDGKVFPALMEPVATATCQEFLEIEHLGPGELARGVLVFEAPNESYFRSSLLAFQPPRWGGESRVEVRLPACLVEPCPAAKQASSKKPDQ